MHYIDEMFRCRVMKILTTLFDIVRRNPFTVLWLVMIIIAAPWLLGAFAIFLLIPLIIIAIFWVVILIRIRKVQKSMRDAAQGGTYTAGQGNYGTKTDGKVTVHIPHQEPKVSEDVGEYVSFKEIDE